MPEQDVSVWSPDPKDPNWRIRVHDDGQGLYRITEEDMTSTNRATAQITEVNACILMTEETARALYAALGKVLSKTSERDAA